MTRILRALRAFVIFPLGPDWNARLEADRAKRADPKYLQRRQSAKRGWATRRGAA